MRLHRLTFLLALAAFVLITRADALDQWLTRTSPGPVILQDVIYAKGLFVAVGTDTNAGTPPLIVSGNGMDWTRFASFAQFTPRALAYGNGLLVGVGRADLFDITLNPGVIVSTNGTNWTYFPTFGNALVKTNFEAIAYANGIARSTCRNDPLCLGWKRASQYVVSHQGREARVTEPDCSRHSAPRH